ncbi:tyrosyl-DNA phosphodiesterase-domain-containing protein [Xylariaceae sp. FL1651]|nr:tyrosyl-DNA phosphodiesterase-domain-containing protein [Xylariaceae sp. FL1651]
MGGHDDAFDGDEDAALRYAIALSLQEANVPVSPSTGPKPIRIDSDDSRDDDLEDGPKYPPTPKKANHQSADKDCIRGTSAALSFPPAVVQTIPAATQLNSFAALGLDRKKMEEERLRRSAKRKAPSIDDKDSAERPPRRVKIESQLNGMPFTSTTHATASVKTPLLPYSKGVVKKTWAFGYPRQDDIKIEEIFQKDELELAVLSSFQWDDAWMLSKIDIMKTKIVCIAFASNEAHKAEMRANVPKDRIRFCFPPMMPAGSMHSKLQLLKFPKYLRIVVPTGNLVPYDWGETGVMENMVFLIDLPLLEGSAITSSNCLTMFGQELCFFLKASGLDESLVSSLLKYDFSETDRYRFIHTIGQSHVGEDWQRTGYCGLGRAVKSLGLATASEVELDFVVASLGSVNTDLISAIYNAALGDNGMREYESRSARSGKKKAGQESDWSHVLDKFRIYFPSHETVSQSRGGKSAGGTICLQNKWWASATFPRRLIRDCKSVRSGLLMHTKVLFVRRSGKASWAYLGSANLSESAWGRLVKDRTSGQPKLNCRNWECGVLIPLEGEPVAADLSAFEKSIPVPMVIPGDPYGKTNSKQPWLFLEA